MKAGTRNTFCGSSADGVAAQQVPDAGRRLAARVAERYGCHGVQYLDGDDRRAQRACPIPNRPDTERLFAVWACAMKDLSQPSDRFATLQALLEQAPAAMIVGRSASNPAEVRNLLERAGLQVLFHGRPPRDRGRPGERAVLSIVRKPRPVTSAPASFRVVAFVGAYNEEGVIVPFLEHTIAQGVDVCLLDNWSTDRTAERAARFLGRGVTAILKFPEGGPAPTHEWRRMLTRKVELAARTPADWFLHLDPDEVRESPWPDVTLRDALYRVDQEGFNAVDHTCVIFHPTGGPHREDLPLQPQFPHFEFGTRPGHFVQIKAWKRQSVPVDCAGSGGHEVRFAGRRVYPFNFLLRHYPVLSQEHGERKVFRERLPRFSPDLRQLGWHRHYDGLAPGHCFVRDPATLLTFDPDTFYEDHLVDRLGGGAAPSEVSLRGGGRR